eukprot:3185682-Amphidinium_carterae.1
MKMTLLIQHIQGDIRSHMLMNYKLSTADFDESCTKVEDYYRNVYIDNSGGQISGLQKPNKKPWPPWKKKQQWKNGYEKGKYDYDSGKGGKDKRGKDPYNKGYDKGTTEREKTKVMEENPRGHHYHPTTATTGKERKVEKEKETRASFQ